MIYVQSSAILSECGTYRYLLERKWEIDLPLCCWVMLNPSIADGLLDDQTIRKCVAFAKRWGFGGILVVNLFALRSTAPWVLTKHPDPVGAEGDEHILKWARRPRVGKVVVAWGNYGVLNGRGDSVSSMLKSAGVQLHCLRMTQAKQPAHPLYLPLSLSPIDF